MGFLKQTWSFLTTFDLRCNTRQYHFRRAD
jgi:hypothetical protein